MFRNGLVLLENICTVSGDPSGAAVFVGLVLLLTWVFFPVSECVACS